MTIGIIGLGLMGGSLGMDLRRLPFVKEVIGHDHNPEHRAAALQLKLVDQIVDFDTLLQCDTIILSIPVDGIIAVMQTMPGKIKPDATVIDLGSTKARIVESIPGWAHDITNIGDTEVIVMLWANEVFDPARPDTYACKV